MYLLCSFVSRLYLNFSESTLIMLEFASRLALSLIINCLVLWLQYVAKRCEQLQQHISEKSYRLLLRTQDLKFCRALEFSHAGVHKVAVNADRKSLEIEFESATMFLKLCLQRSSKAFMTAMQTRRFKLKGDLTSIPWFAQLAKIVMPSK